MPTCPVGWERKTQRKHYQTSSARPTARISVRHMTTCGNRSDNKDHDQHTVVCHRQRHAVQHEIGHETGYQHLTTRTKLPLADQGHHATNDLTKSGIKASSMQPTNNDDSVARNEGFIHCLRTQRDHTGTGFLHHLLHNAIYHPTQYNLACQPQRKPTMWTITCPCACNSE